MLKLRFSLASFNIGFLVLFLSVIVAFRGNTRDTFNYIEVYRGLNDFPWSPSAFQEQYLMDWGFGLIAGLVKIAGLPPTFLLFIVSAITFLAISKSSKNFGSTAWSTIPFYLSTFFLSQQFMQIRQGLSVAFIFLAISYFIRPKKGRFGFIFSSLVGCAFHAVSIIPLFTSVFLRWTLPRLRSFNNLYWIIVLFIMTIGACRAISSFELFFLFERIQAYINDPEYHSIRGVLDIANLRAILLACVFYVFRPHNKELFYSSYMLLLGIFVVGLGVRFGFIDFEILSGRVGSALGFSEIYLLPLMINNLTKNYFKRGLFTLLYFIIHLSATLSLQVPYLVEDYFQPIPG